MDADSPELAQSQCNGNLGDEIPPNHSNLLKMIRFPESFSESLLFFEVCGESYSAASDAWALGVCPDPSEIERVLGGDGIAVIRA